MTRAKLLASISWVYSREHGDGLKGWYYIRMGGDTVRVERDERERDLFIAELKARILLWRGGAEP